MQKNGIGWGIFGAWGWWPCWTISWADGGEVCPDYCICFSEEKIITPCFGKVLESTIPWDFFSSWCWTFWGVLTSWLMLIGRLVSNKKLFPTKSQKGPLHRKLLTPILWSVQHLSHVIQLKVARSTKLTLIFGCDFEEKQKSHNWTRIKNVRSSLRQLPTSYTQIPMLFEVRHLLFERGKSQFFRWSRMIRAFWELIPFLYFHQFGKTQTGWVGR